MLEFIIVYVTAGSAKEAEQLAQALVGEKLAACVNRIKSIQSTYRWQGHVEERESVEQAALREVREETGLEGKLIRKLGDIGYSYREKEGHEPVRIYKRVHFYLLRYLRGDMRDHDHEADDVRWFPIEQA